jgi:hypothetical protein
MNGKSWETLSRRMKQLVHGEVFVTPELSFMASFPSIFFKENLVVQEGVICGALVTMVSNVLCLFRVPAMYFC